MTPLFNPPPSRRGPIREWDTRRCPDCRRRRVHFRVEAEWRCIGRLPGRRYAQKCGEAA